MSRPLRIEYEGAWYHVMNRGRGRQVIFPDDVCRHAFLETLGEACRRFALEVHAYCLMPNHYHLLVRTPEGNLSRAMRHVDGVYTQRYNRHAGTDGPLFRGRYKAILVDADSYLLSVSRYIHRNPVDGDRPLVERLADWPWSSYPAYIDAADPPTWLERTPTWEAVGGRDRGRRYRSFVEAGVEQEIAAYYANQRATPILGDERFRQWALGRAPERWEVPEYTRRRFRDPAEIIDAAAAASGLTRAELTARARPGRGNRFAARQLAMRLCRDETGLALREIGEWFGGIHYASVSQNIRRAERDLKTDRTVQRLNNDILSRLDP